MKVVAQKKMKMIIDFTAFFKYQVKQRLFNGHSCVVVFLAISSDYILSAIHATQKDKSSFPKYKRNIFFE